jgi:hypothetical protein
MEEEVNEARLQRIPFSTNHFAFEVDILRLLRFMLAFPGHCDFLPSPQRAIPDRFYQYLVKTMMALQVKKETSRRIEKLDISFGYEGSYWDKTGHILVKINWIWQSSTSDRVTRYYSKSILLSDFEA